MLVVAVFFTGGFYFSELLFLATGTPRWLLRPVKASTSSELRPGHFQLLYICQVFLSHIYRERYNFEQAFFTNRSFFFTLHSFPIFFGTICDSVKARTPHRGSSSVSIFTELSLPAEAWTWTIHTAVTRLLICRLRQWTTKYRVKIELLNMFCLFKLIWDIFLFQKRWTIFGFVPACRQLIF